jgi:7-cyano-7-deazaguanine tRNA-ribosyltransferase
LFIIILNEVLNILFEVIATDLAGRVGKLHTKSGTFETPCVLPVIHPVKQIITPKKMEKMGFKALMTNSYITMKSYAEKASKIGIHGIIDYDGIIMTDSGGYQILEYGKIKVDPLDIARFQESIGSDIAVILDTPTGIKVSRKRALMTVRQTLMVAKNTLDFLKKKDTLWVGPIQGGNYLDLVKTSSRKISQMDFDIFALGSPTEVMGNYDFNLLAQMIVSAKQYLPLDKPLHLFGAGHPITIPLVVALGCDLFDSASYILYAKNDRYMTDYGTSTLQQLKFLPCNCPVCSDYKLNEIKKLTKIERTEKLAIHNLYMLRKEITITKQAIFDGRLWDYVRLKSRSHPKLYQSFEILYKNNKIYEENTPLFKPKAIFYYDYFDQKRPEVIRYMKRIFDVTISRKKKTLLLFSERELQSFIDSSLLKKITVKLGKSIEKVQFCLLSLTYGIIPNEILDMYPLTQTMNSIKENKQSIKFPLEFLKKFLKKNHFEKKVIINLYKSDGFFEKTVQKMLDCELIDLSNISDIDNHVNEVVKKISE